MSVRYTFFELATQKGQIMAAFSELLPRHWVRGCTSTPDGEGFVFEARRYDHDTEPAIQLVITGKTHRESQHTWADRARREAHAAWESYVQERQRQTRERQRQYGVDGKDGEEASRRALLALEKIEEEKRVKALLSASAGALSTPSPTQTTTSPSATSLEAAGSTESAPSGPTKTESASTPTSTAPSSKTSKRTGSRSRSSSGT